MMTQTTGTDSISYNPTMAEDKGNIELDPNDPLFYNTRGFSYSELGQYQRAIELDSNLAGVYNNRL